LAKELEIELRLLDAQDALNELVAYETCAAVGAFRAYVAILARLEVAE
jgi:hypothetical protein